jgi:L-rhamnose-H+ transport protein
VGKNLEMGKFLVGFYGVFALGSTGRFGLLASTRSRDRVRIPINPISGQAFYLGCRLGACAVGGGVGLHRVGFAISGSILSGIGATVGTLAPLVLQHSEMLFQTSGLLLLVGTALMLAGVTLCGWAGYRRQEKAREQGRAAGFSLHETAMSQTASTRAGFIASVAVLVASGVLSSLLNIALAYGGDIIEKARAQGAQPAWAPFAVWPIALLGGSLVNIGYSCYLLSRNGTAGKS